MGRSPSTFRQTDITRALKAIRAAGYSAVRVLIDKAGRIEIATATEGEAQAATTHAARDSLDDTDLDHELADWEKRRGRQVSP